jgi:anti-anti-sigma factor
MRTAKSKDLNIGCLKISPRSLGQNSTHDDQILLCLLESVDQNTSAQLGRHLLAFLEEHRGPFLIDFSRVKKIDTSGLATLLDFQRRMWVNGKNIAIFGAQATVKAWFEVFMVSEVLQLHQTEEGARKALNTPRAE